MARIADKTDSYISMVLDLNGRVRPADLQSIPQESRVEALRAFAETHGADMQLHLAGDELVAGPAPSPTGPAVVQAAVVPDPAPDPAPAAPAAPLHPSDLTPEGESALDLLLGDYDGVPQVAPVPATLAPAPSIPAAAAGGDAFAARPATRASGSSVAPGRTEPAPDIPADTARAWMLWWIPTLLLPLIGGATAWFFLRRKRMLAARAMLATGLVLGLVLSVAWLRYAEQIAAIADQRAADSVIVLPSK